MNAVIIGIGSNICPEENIGAALERMGEVMEIIKVSGFFLTAPIGITDQPAFLNGAVKVNTLLEMEELQSLLKSIENILGRDRTLPKFGPRTIDLDIVAWNGKIVDNDYFSRNFLRESVDEIM